MSLCLMVVILVLFNYIDSTYITYSIQYECSESPDRRILLTDSQRYSAIILRSNTEKVESNQLCKAKIVDRKVVGFVITIPEISLNSENCEDFILIDERFKWCRNNQSENLTIFKNQFNIVFNTGNNSSSKFSLTITAFNDIKNQSCAKDNEFLCEGRQPVCIYNKLECDGHSNCPNGSDEKECPLTLGSKDDEQFEDKIDILEDNHKLQELNKTDKPLNISKHNIFTAFSSNENQDSGHNLTNKETTLLVIVILTAFALITGITGYSYKRHLHKNQMRYRLISNY